MPEIHPPDDPSAILQTAFAFWSSKVLLSAVEMDVFTRLGRERLTGAELGAQLGLHPRGIGKPQNEIKHSQKPMFEELYSDLPRLEQFMGAMTGLGGSARAGRWGLRQRTMTSGGLVERIGAEFVVPLGASASQSDFALNQPVTFEVGFE
jgi:hypothetical protein